MSSSGTSQPSREDERAFSRMFTGGEVFKPLNEEQMRKPDLEQAHEATEAEPTPTHEEADALRAENLKLETQISSLQALMRDQNKKIRELAGDLRQACKERDEIIQVAEKMKHQRELKPRQIQKALNGISKIVK